MPDSLSPRVFADAEAAGRAAAADVADALRDVLATQPEAHVVFAAAPSQEVLLRELIAQPGVDWQRVTAFHMDEYVGLPMNAPQRFGNWLRHHFFDRVPLRAVYLVGADDDPQRTACEYAELVARSPIDVVCLGIGVNGHLAFNDPPVADFADPQQVKVVELDEVCRQQQVDDGCFARFADVPTHAITLTVPTLLSGKRLFCVVSGGRKRNAVRRTLHDPISPACPATALRTHPDCRLYLDREAYPNGN